MVLSKIIDYIKHANGRATDLSHIMYGFISALVPDFAVQALAVAVYFAYQVIEWLVRSKRGEHREKEMADLVGDMREFMAGFTLGLVIRYKIDIPV